MASPTPSLDELVEGILAQDRTLLARAITLVESGRRDDEVRARELLSRLLECTGEALRVGISGVPGVGKSTFIERLGGKLIAAGHRVAVLAIDPSSSISGGSILGDKSRMNTLAREENAFIRPSPSARTLGGVARRTRETMLLCEAAGFDVILVETVGVGQSETLVAEMVDCFCVLMLPGAGDELQGIKKGILELADIVAVNKADGENITAAREAARTLTAALGYTRGRGEGWKPKAVTISAHTGKGIDALWELVEAHRSAAMRDGTREEARRGELRRWMWDLLEERLLGLFRENPGVRGLLEAVEEEVAAGEIRPSAGADRLLRAFRAPPLD
jgi:LAO/AO transport system kinase